MTRTQELKAMSANLEIWADQIADLEAKVRTAAADRRQALSIKIAALRQRRWAYETQLAKTQGASAAVFGDMQLGATRMADEFRRIYLTTASRFPS